MNSIAAAALLAFVCALVSCEHDVFNISLDALKDLSEGARHQIEVRINNLTEAIEDKWDIVHDLMEGQENETAAEDEGIDASGCDRTLRKHFEDRCDEEYEKVSDEAQLIENDAERTEAVCCSLEDFEKCSLRAYDQANCVTDKAAIRENLKAARLFLTVIANITCSQFRGQCAYYSSSAVSGYASLVTVLASMLIPLFIAKFK